MRYYAGEGSGEVGEVIPASRPSTLQYTRRDPVGIVGIITPWNFPSAIPVWKMASALVYGNAVVFKPAELSSLTARRLVSPMALLLPAGVVNLVIGRGADVGEAVIRHPQVEAISLTGSVGVGEHIRESVTVR